MTKPTIIPVILCGGSGTRLWPASREAYPKQFLNLVGDLSLLQQTMQRSLRASGAAADHLVTVTLGALQGEVVTQLSAIDNAATQHILSEPSARNTGAAVAFAASYVAEKFGGDALLWILPADHHIGDELALSYALTNGVKAANNDYLVTFGIQPTRAETGYGYIRAGRALKDDITCIVEEFVEKPDLYTAKAYLQSGDYLWNSGMFLFKAKTVLSQFEQYSPSILSGVRNAMHAGTAAEPLSNIYAAIEEQPFDKAIMERSPNVAVIPCDLGWSDIGSWESLWELRTKDAHGNVMDGRVAYHDTENCLVEGRDRLIACAGLRDIVIIETGDALLIANRKNSDAMKVVVKTLKQAGASEVLNAPADIAAGHAERSNPAYLTHEHEVTPGHPLQFTAHEMATLFLTVLEGEGQILIGSDTKKLTTGGTLFIPNDMPCVISATSGHPLKIVEVAKPLKHVTGQYQVKKKVA